jgi:L-ascorbate metabolism protein UlaG (beta-lactamase superfamily)
MMLAGLSVALMLGLALPSSHAACSRAAVASEAQEISTHEIEAPPADAHLGEMLLAEGEGDVDESFNSHGADTDEEMETDNAKMPQDTTKKVTLPVAPSKPVVPRPSVQKPKVQRPGSPMPLSPEAELKDLTRGIRWLGQSAILLQDGKNIYIDPYDLGEGLPPADIILITHDHSDHLSPADIAKIIRPTTVVVTVPSAVAKLPKQGTVRTVKPGDTLTVEGVRIEAVPAYNTAKQFHPKEKRFVGFIVHLGARSIYHAGDTDLIPEMKDFKADVALLPIGGTYTMTASEAAKAANIIKPKVAIPMHYGSIVGSPADAQTFKAEAKVPVLIMEPEAKQAEPDKPSK